MTSLANENFGCHVISGGATFKNRQKARPEKKTRK